MVIRFIYAYKQSDGTILVSGENSNILLTESNFEQLISEVMYAVNNRGEFTMKIIKSKKIIFVAITVTIIICLGMTIVLYQDI